VYPNPFSNQTNIQFAIEKSCPAKLEVYNNAGQKVSILIDKNLTEGNHVTNWNVSGLPQGVYLLRLQAGERTVTQKIIKVQ
jgi:hypothetical protein